VLNVKKKPWMSVRVEQMGMFRRGLRTVDCALRTAGGRLVCVCVPDNCLSRVVGDF
jgi:hypothetical protein